MKKAVVFSSTEVGEALLQYALNNDMLSAEDIANKKFASFEHFPCDDDNGTYTILKIER